MPDSPADFDLTNLPKAVRKRLQALGFQVATWQRALNEARAHYRASRFPDALQSALDPAFDLLTEEISTPLEALTLPLWLDPDHPEGFLIHPDASTPAASPAARALLHLPGLRRHWGQQLRANLFADLRLRLPQAWLVDPAPLPISHAFGGLSIAAWSDLDLLRDRSFRVTQSGQSMVLQPDTEEATWTRIAQQLATGGEAERSVIEAWTPAANAIADYGIDENQRWTLLGLRAGS